MAAIVVPALALNHIVQQSHMRSPAWTAVFFIIVGYAVLVDFRPWFTERIDRINAWNDVRSDRIVKAVKKQAYIAR